MKARFVFFATIIAASVLAACGGGGGTGLPTCACPAPVPSVEAMTSAVSASTTTAVQFSAISNGTSGSITLPAANAATTASLTLQAALPSGVATPQMRALKGRAIIGGSNLQTLAVITLSVSNTVAVTQTPAFSFTLSSAPSGDTYVAYFDENNPANGWNVLLGPGSVSGSTVTFTAKAFAPPFTLTANDTYVFALIASSTAATQAASLSYSGTKTIEYQYGYSFAYPSPSPRTTQPPQTLSYAVAATVTLGNSPAPVASASGLLDEHVAETDTGSLDTQTYTTDSWLGITSSTTFSELLYATSQQEPSSATEPTITTAYATPQTTDIFPQTPGSWTNNPAATITYAYQDGDSGMKTVASNGTYTDTENLLASGAGGSATMTENSDGSGSIVAPFAGGLVTEMSFSSPIPSPSPNITIGIYYSTYAQTNFGVPAVANVQDVVWYSQPLKLYTESDAITTGTALPGSCIPNAFNFTTANDVHRVLTTTDTLIGYVETTTIDSYEYNGVPVCLVTNDTQKYAYNEQANQPYIILFGPLGIQEVTTVETLVLTGSPSAAQQAAQGRPQSIGVALQAHEVTTFARASAKRTRTTLTNLRGGRP